MLMGGNSNTTAFFAEGGGGSIRPSEQRRRPAAVESWTATAADVEAWMKHAAPGDRMVYASGPTLVQGAAAALVRKLADAREVASHNRRNPDGVLEYVIIRNRVRVVTQRAPVCNPLMMAVLIELQDDAQNHRRCRSDAELGEATGMTADQVKWQLKKLGEAKMIERRIVPTPGDLRFRVVKVLATGAETALPGGAA
jgi:hypothetical protein